jgi:hypothetical protein
MHVRQHAMNEWTRIRRMERVEGKECKNQEKLSLGWTLDSQNDLLESEYLCESLL